MKDNEIDNLLQAARASHEPDPGLDSDVLNRITASIQQSLKPVRPLPARWVFIAGLLLIGAAVAIAGAARAGFFGIEQMSSWQRLLIFSTLGVLAVITASEFASAMIPGRLRRISSGALLTVAIAALLAVFSLSFRDYQTTNFVSAGLACLLRGLLHAVPVALLSWLLLRRGFAVKPISAGLAAGALSGLAGLGVLELNCTNFQAAHVLIWHTAVVLVSATAGALIGWALHRLRSPRA
jgi:hypothetical protein